MKRTKDWIIPENTVYVGRPSKWGNPYPVSIHGREAALELYDICLQKVLEAHPDFLDALKGKNLACWCPLDKPCHADILLKLLNKN